MNEWNGEYNFDLDFSISSPGSKSKDEAVEEIEKDNGTTNIEFPEDFHLCFLNEDEELRGTQTEISKGIENSDQTDRKGKGKEGEMSSMTPIYPLAKSHETNGQDKQVDDNPKALAIIPPHKKPRDE